MDGPGGEDLLFRWVDQGLMTRDNILGRIDQHITQASIIRDEEDKFLNHHFQDYGITVENSTTRYLDEISFSAFLGKSFDLSSPTFLSTFQAVFQSTSYLAFYPFPPELPALTTSDLKHALVLLLPVSEREDRWRIDRLVDAHNCGRARTKWDRYRLLFQSFAKRRPGNGLPFDENVWMENAERRAGDYECPCEDYTVTNRDEDGDEIFHDYVDFMEATQLLPVISPIARISRNPFRSVARMLTRENRSPRLEDMVIGADELSDMCRVMLCLHLDSSGDYFQKHTDELTLYTSRVVAAFTRSETGVNWEMFASALDRTAPWLFKPLHYLMVSFIRERAPEHKELLPSPLGSLVKFPHLTQLSLFLHDDFEFESFRLLVEFGGEAQDLGSSGARDGLIEALAAKDAEEYPGLLLVSGSDDTTGQSKTFGFWSQYPAKDSTEIQPPKNLEYQVCSLFQLSPLHDVFPGTIGTLAFQRIADDLVFGNEGSGVSLRLRDGSSRVTIAHHINESRLDKEKETFATTEWRGTWKLDLHIERLEYWQQRDDLLTK